MYSTRSILSNYLYLILTTLLFTGCSASLDLKESESEVTIEKPKDNPANEGSFTYLALGDSYTIGERVCETCRFPAQLKTEFEAHTQTNLETEIIARTGWTTDNLINAISNADLTSDYDLVTLLIGVNNQYQGRSFSQYKTEFPQLLKTAIRFAKGNKERVIVVSIPDYAYTPFGQSTTSPQKISQEIDAYNSFAKTKAEEAGVVFIEITDITRKGLEDPELVASDGLHPSEKAYGLFVKRLLPVVKLILK